MAASTPSLTPVSYVVLGMLDGLGEATSYDLEQLVSTSVGYFWSFPRSQLYSEPARLEAAGLLRSETEQGGRRRRRLQLTSAGRTALQDWLATPDGAGTEIRDLGLLKLFLASSAADPQHVAAGAAAQAASHRVKLEAYEALAGVEGMDPHQAATLRLGLAYERAAVSFWDEVSASAATPAGRPRRRAQR